MYENNYNTRQKQNEYTYVDGIGFAPCAPAITERHVIKEYANGIGFILLLYLLFAHFIPIIFMKSFSVLIAVFRMFGAEYIGTQVVLGFVSTASYIFTMVLPFLIYVIMYHIPTRVILPFSKVKASDVTLMVFMGLGVSTIGMYSSSAISTVFSVFGIIPTAPDISFGSNIFRTALLVIQICIIAPILEEIAFRGIIMQSLRRFGDRFALFMSALFFALIHLNFVQFPNALLMGLVIGYFVLRTNSLRVGIMMHAVNNALAIVTTIVMEQLGVRYSSFVMNLICGFYLIAGIISFLIITKKYKNIFYISGSRNICTNKTKCFWFMTAAPMIFALIIMFTMMVNTLVFT